jgi:hypothetical protein
MTLLVCNCALASSSRGDLGRFGFAAAWFWRGDSRNRPAGGLACHLSTETASLIVVNILVHSKDYLKVIHQS